MFSVNSVLVDTNVWLSYFCGDDANNESAAQALLACNDHGIGMLYAPTSAKDLFYILPRRLRSMRAGPLMTAPSPSCPPHGHACRR